MKPRKVKLRESARDHCISKWNTAIEGVKANLKVLHFGPPVYMYTVHHPCNVHVLYTLSRFASSCF